jgi:chromosome segregation ATPase
MDWSSIIIALGGAGGALGLNEVIRAIVNKWANKKKDAVSVQADVASLEAANIANREKMFTTLSEINDKLASEIAELTQILIDTRSKIAEVINHKITLTMENAELKAQNELLKLQNERLLKENEQLKKSLEELKKEQATMKERIKELEKKI